MSDSKTVVIDLKSMNDFKLKEQEELNTLAQHIEFNVHESGLIDKLQEKLCKVIYLDFQTTLFSGSTLPADFENIIISDPKELNAYLKNKEFQILVMYYNSVPKTINSICTQVRQKCPSTKLLIVANQISPDKALIHAQTSAGAHGYLALPITAEKLNEEFLRIFANCEDEA